MEIKDVIKILDPQFGYWAKSSGELLYAHHFSVWSIFRKLADFVPSLDREEKELVELACLVHDIGKMRKENQEKLKQNEKMVEHRLEIDELKEYFNKVDGYDFTRFRRPLRYFTPMVYGIVPIKFVGVRHA